MPPKHRTGRNDLFLVRFWFHDINETPEGKSGWRGRVQRAVSGESRDFNDWDALVNALRTMLAATSPSYLVNEQPETTGNTQTEAGERGEQ